MSQSITSKEVATTALIRTVDDAIGMEITRDKATGDIRMLVATGADVNALNEAEATSLHRAVVYGKFYLVKILIECGADVSVKDSQGYTPLMISQASTGNKSQAVIKDFIESHIASIEVYSSEGRVDDVGSVFRR